MDCPICKSDNDPKTKFCIVCGIKISDVDFINNIDFVEQKLKTSQNGSKSIQIINSPDAVVSWEGDARGKDESFNFKSIRGSKGHIDESIAQKTNLDIDKSTGQRKTRENKNFEIQYIKPDDSKTIQKDSIIKDGLLSGSHKWIHSPQSIAILIPKTEMKGLFNNLIIQPNEVAVIVRDGKVEKVVESGKVKVGGLLNINSYFKDVDVVMMDTSPKDANWQVEELWTSDKHKIAAKGLLRYRTADPKKFFLMVYAYSIYNENRVRFLTLDGINERIKSEVLTRVLQPEISDMELDDIYGNRELQHKIENEIELQLKQTLNMWGLELLRFTSEWNLGGNN